MSVQLFTIQKLAYMPCLCTRLELFITTVIPFFYRENFKEYVGLFSELLILKKELGLISDHITLTMLEKDFFLFSSNKVQEYLKTIIKTFLLLNNSVLPSLSDLLSFELLKLNSDNYSELLVFYNAFRKDLVFFVLQLKEEMTGLYKIVETIDSEGNFTINVEEENIIQENHKKNDKHNFKEVTNENCIKKTKGLGIKRLKIVKKRKAAENSIAKTKGIMENFGPRGGKRKKLISEQQIFTKISLK